MEGNLSQTTAPATADAAAVAGAESALVPEKFDHQGADQNEALLYRGETRKLRRRYGWTLLIMLGVQMLAMNVAFILVGVGLLTYDAITLRVFIGATVTQVVALVIIIVRHLFPNNSDRKRGTS
jgi:hypothetical protein